MSGTHLNVHVIHSTLNERISSFRTLHLPHKRLEQNQSISIYKSVTNYLPGVNLYENIIFESVKTINRLALQIYSSTVYTVVL